MRLIIDQKVMWLFLMLFGLRPWYRSMSPLWVMGFNVVLWMASIFYVYVLGAAVVKTADVHFAPGSAGALAYTTLSTFSLTMHVINAPITHGVCIAFFYWRNTTLTPLERRYESAYRSSISEDHRRGSGDSAGVHSVLQATAADDDDHVAVEMRSADVKRKNSLTVARNILSPARTGALNRDFRIITVLLVYMVVVQTTIILFTRSRHVQTQTVAGKIVICIIGFVSDSISWTALALLMMVTRIALRQIRHYVLAVERGQFTTPEELFTFHLALRAYFIKNTRYFTWITSLLVLGTAVYTTAVIFWLYFRLVPYLSNNRAETLLYFTVLPVYILSVVAALVWCLASVNDLHDRLKSVIVEHQLFSLAARTHLLAEIEMFPINIPVFGVVLTSDSFKRMLVSLVIAVIPGVVQALSKS